jgi:hypothetical protein
MMQPPSLSAMTPEDSGVDAVGHQINKRRRRLVKFENVK